MTLDTKALPAGPESAAEVRDLQNDGWRVTGRSHGVVRLAQTVPDQATGKAPDPPSPEPIDDVASEAASVVSGPSADETRAAADLRSAIVDALGVRAADALAASGFHSLAHARSAYEAAPDSFGALPGIGPATLAKLSA